MDDAELVKLLREKPYYILYQHQHERVLAADRIEALVESARNEGYRAGLKSLADTIESAKVRLTLGRDWVTADQQELTAQAYRHIARAALAAFDNTKENK